MARSATRLNLGKDPAYLAFVRTLACLLCLRTRAGLSQMSPTEAAHVGERGLSQKCPDTETLPLCRWHHTEGPESHHRLGKRFWEVWGLNREELIKSLNAQFRERAA